MDHILLQNTITIRFSLLIPVCGSLVPYNDPGIIPEGGSSKGRQGGDEKCIKICRIANIWSHPSK